VAMSTFALARRWLALTAFAAWVGGFMFYGGAVVPALGDQMDAVASGAITRRVTDLLNRLGAMTLALWWFQSWSERKSGPRWARGVGVACLGISTVLLAWLFALHAAMDAILDDGSMSDFHGLHKIYLTASTAQWAANLGLLAAAVRTWTAPPRTIGDAP